MGAFDWLLPNQLTQPLGYGPLSMTPPLAKAQSNATGASIPAVKPPPYVTGPELLNSISNMNSTNADVALKQQQAALTGMNSQFLAEKLKAMPQFMALLNGANGGTGGGQGSQGSSPPSQQSAPSDGSSAASAPSSTSAAGNWGDYADPAIAAMKKAGASDAFTQGAMANGLGEGGFTQPWKKAGGDENSYGHWQFNDNGELPEYQAWVKQTSPDADPHDTGLQAQYLVKRMEEISPGITQTGDPKAATDAIATGFERYKGAAPGQRYGLLAAAQQHMNPTPDAGGTATNTVIQFPNSQPTGPQQLTVTPAARAIAASMSPPSAPGAPPVTGGAVPTALVPGAPTMATGMDPMALARLGAMAQLYGFPDVATPLAQAYYKSPQYLQQAAGAGEAGKLPYVGPEAMAKVPAELATKWNSPTNVRGLGLINPAGPPGNNIIAGIPKLQQVVGPDGAKTIQWVMPPGAPMPGVPGSPTAATTGAGLTTELGPGQEEALKTRAEEEQKQRQAVITDANNAQQSRATLMNMANETGNFIQGPFAQHAQTAAQYLRLIDPSYNGQVASYEDFVKNAGSLTRQAVKEVSSRAAVQEYNMIGSTLPNPEMSPQGIQRVQNELIGLSDFKLAKAQAQQQWEQAHGGIGNVSGFETDFQKNASPSAFIVARMDPLDRQGMIAKLQGTKEGQQELGKLGQELQYIKQAGLAP